VTVAVAMTPSVPPPRSDELDEVTLRRAQRGDADAGRALVERYQAPVFALLGRMLGGVRRVAVEDLAQDTFLAVFAALPRFRPDGAARLSTWILTIATRRAIDELRRRPPVPIAVDDVAPPRDRADTTAERRQLAAAIDRALAELSPPYRAAFILRELHGLDYGEVALALGIDLGTVRSRLARARAALRTALAEHHHG
jgi:RNA polymerase sigma-70 factor (ECF subfamily)